VAIGPEILNGVYGGSKAFVLAFSQSLKDEGRASPSGAARRNRDRHLG
jgi:short-subunit dehydrogenase